ncbi:glycosyltransferase family 2 protein, partial [Hymenobacter defluvii]
MDVFSVPGWINKFKFPYKCYEEIPRHLFDYINKNLYAIQSEEPLVSVIISAWNEETNILTCIASLAKIETAIPFEIIVVNNNSTDKTQDTLD